MDLTQNIFPNHMYLSIVGFITFIKAPYSPLIHQVKVITITFSFG